MKKKYIFSICLLVISAGCNSTNLFSKNLTGQDLKYKYKKIESFIYSFENDELDGAITETYVNVYKIKNKKCVILGRTYGDSGYGGSEDLIFFKNKELLSATLRPFIISNIRDNNVKTNDPKQVNYEEPFPNKDVKSILEKKFQGYLKKMDKVTLRKCSN
ncbi:hypothetical protein [Acinetobacter bereziniae]|uniref:hypothetical protein n=1 Tax=Acinetobacter bereziniae TaxID=106648 RepID=UPI00125F0771|nr:hypothetical protein [Acinetobacter bereziniae]MBI0393934.1 hypothetical protein [Acinetobacter bereziniae]MCU4436071.1 hypothetical protein [Acinetobacter bereziniae]